MSEDGATVRQPRHVPAQGGLLRVFWDGGSRTYPLPIEGTLTIGRLDTCEICVPHPSVSRRHARLQLSRPAAAIEDLGSANGTAVAGRAVAAGIAAPLPSGVYVSLGSALLVLERAAAAVRSPHAVLPDMLVVPGQPLAVVVEHVRRLAAGPIPVLIRGETGVGKEHLAELVHQASPRSGRPLVRVNCAALPGNLLESELFGHEKGAFTGAEHARPGLFEAADGGTLFLDEIGDLSVDLQAKVLRVLERGELLRIGARAARRVDVRLVSATHRDLEGMIAAGQFRPDLFFRLAGATIEVPPLRERRGEIAAIAQHFLARYQQRLGRLLPPLSPDALAALERRSWPGNLRELRHAVERAALLSSSGLIGPTDLRLPPSLADEVAPAPLAAQLAQEEERRIREALDRAGGNQTKAADLLGISRRTLVRRLAEMDLPRPRKG